MKMTLAPSQITYFKKNHVLEFEGLLKENESEALLTQLTRSTPRDLFRQNEIVRKLITKKTFAHLTKELFEVRMLRIAFDQTLVGSAPFTNTKTLQEQCSFQTLLGGLLLRLTDHCTTSAPFPAAKGSGLFFTAGHLIPWKSLEGDTYFLIAFCTDSARYIQNPEDPQTNALKALGYVFGDRLTDPLHPLLR